MAMVIVMLSVRNLPPAQASQLYIVKREICFGKLEPPYPWYGTKIEEWVMLPTKLLSFSLLEND